MDTLLLKSRQIALAAHLLRQGECVAFPTETVYGLGANALDAKAIAKIYVAKGRPSDNPLIIHCYCRSQLEGLAREWPREAEALMDEFWPGPLTLIFNKRPIVPAVVTGGLDTVALRLPDHSIALSLLRATGLPIAAPSANISGRPSPTRAEHVLADMRGKIAAIVDGGATGGLESTVLDCTCRPFRILRPGAITLEQLGNFAPIDQGRTSRNFPASKYRHYSPDAKVVLVSGGKSADEIQRQIDLHRAKDGKIAVLAFATAQFTGASVFNLGDKDKLDAAAAGLYHQLRRADAQGFDLIIVEGVADEGLGHTIMNRLRQAADVEIRT